MRQPRYVAALLFRPLSPCESQCCRCLVEASRRGLAHWVPSTEDMHTSYGTLCVECLHSQGQYVEGILMAKAAGASSVRYAPRLLLSSLEGRPQHTPSECKVSRALPQLDDRGSTEFFLFFGRVEVSFVTCGQIINRLRGRRGLTVGPLMRLLSAKQAYIRALVASSDVSLSLDHLEAASNGRKKQIFLSASLILG